MNPKQEAKVKWFVYRTGCGEVEAHKYLLQSKWRVEEAIRERNTDLRIKNEQFRKEFFNEVRSSKLQ